MASVLTIPLTVKMRMGIEDDKPIATKLVYDIRSWGTAAAVTVRRNTLMN